MEPEFNPQANSIGKGTATNPNAVEDITRRLDQMNVDMIDVEIPVETRAMDQRDQQQQFIGADINLDSSVVEPLSMHQYHHSNQMFNRDNNYGNSIDFKQHQQQQSDETILMQDEDNNNDDVDNNNLTHQHQQAQSNSTSNILIVTNVDSSVFNDKLVQSNFEALFLAYDPSVTFRYLKSFRRVRLDFTDVKGAELARSNLSHYKLGNTEFRCYCAQIIRPDSYNSQMNSSHLNIPKLTKQFLISPPASPPVGWEPVTEGSPCIDVQLISAIANLVPGKVHEIHPGSESQPGIYVEVCEDVRYDASMKSCSRIPRTMSPGCCHKILNILAFVAMFVVIASVASAHKNKLYSQAQFDGRQDERCVCDCGIGGQGGQGGPILPNRPYYGNAGYGGPRPSGGQGGYGNQGSYAVSGGSYGNGGGRVTGGY